MKVLLSARVEADLANQLEYGTEQFGKAIAQRCFDRVDEFIFTFLSDYPRAGRYLEELDIYETWIARTPFVIFYRVDDEAQTITVLALFHHSQDRSAFDPKD
jgi:plasmid stabilization system protein ParE